MDQPAVPGDLGDAVESGRKNPDDVIGLLERLLAALLIVVVVLVSQNLLLESVALVAALRLPLASRSNH